MKNKMKSVQAFNWRDTCKAISWYRRSLNLTQGELAKRIGVGYATVSQWESELKQPKLENIVKVAQLFGLTETELIHPSDEVKRWTNLSLKES